MITLLYGGITIMNKEKAAHQWEDDIQYSKQQYNEWYIRESPATYTEDFVLTSSRVESFFRLTNNLENISVQLLKEHPNLITVLRMCTSPVIAHDRLSGLANVPKHVLKRMNEGFLPSSVTDDQLERIITVTCNLLEERLFPWVFSYTTESDKIKAINIAIQIVTDRVSSSISSTKIKMAQEVRQLNILITYLRGKGYSPFLESNFEYMPLGTYSPRLNVPGIKSDGTRINIPVDLVVKSFHQNIDEVPILIECKSAGDSTNTNKRRKEEASKYASLKRVYGSNIHFVLFLCGYFERSYLAYNASEGIDWAWDHRVDDLEELITPRE